MLLENRVLGLRAAYLKAQLYFAVLRLGPRQMTPENVVTVILQEMDRYGLEVPLRMRLFVKNMKAINRMLSYIGNETLDTYIKYYAQNKQSEEKVQELIRQTLLDIGQSPESVVGKLMLGNFQAAFDLLERELQAKRSSQEEMPAAATEIELAAKKIIDDQTQGCDSISFHFIPHVYADSAPVRPSGGCAVWAQAIGPNGRKWARQYLYQMPNRALFSLLPANLLSQNEPLPPWLKELIDGSVNLFWDINDWFFALPLEQQIALGGGLLFIGLSVGLAVMAPDIAFQIQLWRLRGQSIDASDWVLSYGGLLNEKNAQLNDLFTDLRNPILRNHHASKKQQIKALQRQIEWLQKEIHRLTQTIR